MTQENQESTTTSSPTSWKETTVQGQHKAERRVQVSRADLVAAVHGGVITKAQARALWLRWADPALAASMTAAPSDRPVAAQASGPASGPRFTAVNTLYYFGGMLAITAMTTFMTLSWSAFGPWGLFVLSAGYLVAALKVADHLQRTGLTTPAGIVAALAVCLVPLLVWCVQNGLGLWPPGGAAR